MHKQSIWRNAGRTPTILMMDARALFPLFIWLMHMRMWTFVLAVLSTIFFAVLAWQGYSLPVLIRTIHHKVRGPVCYARPWWHRRRFFG